MNNVAIRVAGLDDLDEIYALDKSELDGYLRDSIKKTLQDLSSLTLVAEMDGKIVGYINFSFVLDEAELNKIVTRKDCRGRGIASSLISDAIEILKDRGILTIFLEVREDNVVAQKLYEKVGFKFYYTREKYYNGVNAKLYRLDLNV